MTSTTSHTHIRSWDPQRMERAGFTIAEQGHQARITYPDRRLRLALTADPSTSARTIAGITEVPTFPWQPEADQSVVMRVTLRFDEPAPPPNTTAIVALWNAPRPPERLPTIVGISRDHGAYMALVAQDFNPATGGGLLQRAAMPGWLDPTDWHTLHIELAIDRAAVRVAQGPRRAVVAAGQLLHPPEPLAVELSIDNDNFPEGRLPVVAHAGLEVQSLAIKRLG